MKAVLIIFAILIFAVGLPFLFTQLNTFQTEPFSDTQTGITTAPGITTANVTLSLPLFGDKLANVTHITSNITEYATVLTPGSYDSYSQQLAVNGLAEDATRSLTITYKTDALTNISGFSGVVGYIPFVLVVGGVVFLVSKVAKHF